MAKRKRYDKSRRGQYYRVHPVDLALLRTLPEEGSSLGFHVIAKTNAHLLKEMNDLQPNGAPDLTHDYVASRLRSMHVAGLVTKVPVAGVGSGNGWQRTLKGELRYAEETGETLPTQLNKPSS